MNKVGHGKFKMLTPIRSIYGHIIVGAIVGEDKPVTYSRRLIPTATMHDIRRAVGELREEIHKNHPGVKEEYTMMRPKVAYN